MPRKAANSPDPGSTAKNADFQQENVPECTAEAVKSAKCKKSVKSAGNGEILDQNANQSSTGDAEQQKKEPRYNQKKSNDDTRKDLALEYIERKTTPKKRANARGNFPNCDDQLRTEPGDNARYVMFGMAVYNMSPIDINNAVQVERRIQEYFALCIDCDMKPGVANLAMALGIDRNRLLDIVHDVETRTNVPAETRCVIKKAHSYMGAYWEAITQNGKINPAAAIFLGKNNFGYRDVAEHVLTPNVKTSDTITADDLSRRIESIPDD